MVLEDMLGAAKRKVGRVGQYAVLGLALTFSPVYGGCGDGGNVPPEGEEGACGDSPLNERYLWGYCEFGQMGLLDQSSCKAEFCVDAKGYDAGCGRATEWVSIQGITLYQPPPPGREITGIHEGIRIEFTRLSLTPEACSTIPEYCNCLGDIERSLGIPLYSSGGGYATISEHPWPGKGPCVESEVFLALDACQQDALSTR